MEKITVPRSRANSEGIRAKITGVKIKGHKGQSQPKAHAIGSRWAHFNTKLHFSEYVLQKSRPEIWKLTIIVLLPYESLLDIESEGMHAINGRCTKCMLVLGL